MRVGSRIAARLALLAIRAYQRYLSPLKGFRCALRAIVGGDSCSAYGYRAIRLGGLPVGLLMLRQRLQLCGHVYRKSVAVQNPVLHHQRGHCSCDPPDLACDAGDMARCGKAVFDCIGNCTGGIDVWGCWRDRHNGRPGHSAEMDALEQRIRERRERAERR